MPSRVTRWLAILLLLWPISIVRAREEEEPLSEEPTTELTLEIVWPPPGAANEVKAWEVHDASDPNLGELGEEYRLDPYPVVPDPANPNRFIPTPDKPSRLHDVTLVPPSATEKGGVLKITTDPSRVSDEAFSGTNCVGQTDSKIEELQGTLPGCGAGELISRISQTLENGKWRVEVTCKPVCP